MAVDTKVNAILYLRFGRVHIGLTLYGSPAKVGGAKNSLSLAVKFYSSPQP